MCLRAVSMFYSWSGGVEVKNLVSLQGGCQDRWATPMNDHGHGVALGSTGYGYPLGTSWGYSS